MSDEETDALKVSWWSGWVTDSLDKDRIIRLRELYKHVINNSANVLDFSNNFPSMSALFCFMNRKTDRTSFQPFEKDR